MPRSGRRRSWTTATVVAAAVAVVLVAVSRLAGDGENLVPRVGPPSSTDDAVARVIDGDTLELESGTVVRLVQIDAPEVRGSECYADDASATLAELVPPGTRVRIETDPALDTQDRYGRRLAYVFKGDENVNRTLVEYGAASVWFYDGDRGRYADELLAAAEDARAAGRGLWGACEATLDPYSAITTRHAREGSASAEPLVEEVSVAAGECDESYDPCLPLARDLDCPDVQALAKAPVRVTGSHRYRLDGDGDGVGCE